MSAILAGKRIGLLTAAASRLGGGVFEAVVKQAEMIRDLGGDAVIFGLDDAHVAEDRARFGPSEVHVSPVVGPAQIGFAPALAGAMVEADIDLLHLHGIWMYPSRAATVWARRTGRPYIVSPHGMLDPWITARGKAKKAAARAVYERASWQQASVLHALTPREASDIARESGRKDAAVIPNAGPPASPRVDEKRPPHFLYLGRIHPKKNIGALIEAWRMATEATRAYGPKLTIAGWGEDDHVAELRQQLEGGPSAIEFIGPAYGETKDRLMREARFFVLPSHSEGLPMVILEAWAAATPALMTTECNLPEGFEAGAALDCGFLAGTIAPVLERACAMTPPEWQAMSDAAHGLATDTFSASAVARMWGECYAGLMTDAAQDGKAA